MMTDQCGENPGDKDAEANLARDIVRNDDTSDKDAETNLDRDVIWNDNTGDKYTETNLAGDVVRNANATDTTPALEVLNQTKAAIDTLLKKSEDHNKLNSTVAKKLDVLTTTSRVQRAAEVKACQDNSKGD